MVHTIATCKYRGEVGEQPISSRSPGKNQSFALFSAPIFPISHSRDIVKVRCTTDKMVMALLNKEAWEAALDFSYGFTRGGNEKTIKLISFLCTLYRVIISSV